MSQSPQLLAASPADPRTDPSLLMRLYGTIWWIGFALFTVLMFVWTLLLLPLVLVDRRRRLFHVFSVSFWGWAVYALNPFWSLEVVGRRKLPWDGRAVIVANHDSLADILVVAATFRPFKFVSKESVFRVPILGWAMRINGYIPLRRGDRESVLNMFRLCRGWLEREVPVLLFPEGTRSPDGAVLPFKDGAFQLAVDTDSPVHPVVLIGTRDTLPKHGILPPLRSHVRVRVLDPVHPSQFDGDMAALRDHVRAVIVKEKARLEASL